MPNGPDFASDALHGPRRVKFTSSCLPMPCRIWAIAILRVARYEQSLNSSAEMVSRMPTSTDHRPRTIAVVDGWPVNIANHKDAILHITQAAKRHEGFAVFTLNLDHLVKLRRSSEFRDAYSNARFVTADGAPVAKLASLQNACIERTTGADLVEPLAEAAAQEGLPIYLFGTTDDVLSSAQLHLSRLTGFTLEISGAASPDREFDPTSPAADAALDRIAASGARLCFVALGAPKQELLAARAVERGINVGFICIGAGLDFLAGAQTRAPGFMQRSGLEWFWRLATNPRRLTGRYASCAVVLAEIVFKSLFKQRTA